MIDMVFRFDSAAALAAAFPCSAEPRPPSWRCELVFGTEDAPRSLWVTVLGPQQVTPPYIEVHDETTDTWSREYAYDPAGVIEPGVWCTVTADEFEADLWAMPAAVCWRDRDTGVIVNRAHNQVPLPVRISPTWAGMPSDFVLPVASAE